MPVTEKRMSRLERALENFITSVRDSQMRTESELREFKEEMRVFKDEMRDYKEENKQQLREMNIKWGEMARKLGTITEDLVAPSIPRIIKEEYGLEVADLMVRRKKRLMDGRSKEYDAIAVAGGYVYVDETKSTLDSEDVKDFIEDIQGFRNSFLNMKGKE